LILRESAQKRADHLAVILESFNLTYSQLDAQSSQVASSLKAAGLKKGDRVGLMLPNVPQFPMAPRPEPERLLLPNSHVCGHRREWEQADRIRVRVDAAVLHPHNAG